MIQQEPHPEEEASRIPREILAAQANRRSRIAVKARSQPTERFNNLLHHVTLELVQEELSKIPKGSATGIDERTVTEVKKNLNGLLPPILEQVHQKRDAAPAVKRAAVPKRNEGTRNLGIPTVLDRALQGAMTRVLSEIYEMDYQNSSFGYRPQRGCHHALATLNAVMGSKGAKIALEVDLRDFFGSLNHEWLRKFLGHRISDPRVHALINAWLKAGVMEEGKWQATTQGVPQGGPISALLANIYLHYVLDLWWERKIKKQLQGAGH